MQHATTIKGDGNTGASAKWYVSPGSAPVQPGAYRGSRFAEVWRAVLADPYDALPDKRLGLGSLRDFVVKGIYRAARRTLTTRQDLLPPFDKLVHPTGICLRGSWSIDESTPYSGMFKTGKRGLIIARASDAAGEFRPGKLRFLGLAGKLYDTLDPNHAEPLATANFFTIENLAGSHTRHFVDATLSSDLLPVVPHASALRNAAAAALLGPAFSLADRALTPTQPMIRQLYPLAELGEPDREGCVAPVVMRLAALPNSRRVETADLRQELDLRYHPDGLCFEIQVADHRSLIFARGFRRIGQIHFTESVASYSGDHRLHFAHPQYRHLGRRSARAVAEAEN